MLKTGDAVHIEGRDTWAFGRVEDIRRPQDLPTIDGCPPPEIVAAILAEVDCTRVALISFGAVGKRRTVFAAIETPHGWRDLNGQPLAITLARH